jgi:hypothetical protein
MRFPLHAPFGVRGSYSRSFKQLKLGDVFFADWDRTVQPQDPTHAMVVTRIDENGKRYATYHSKNRLDISVHWIWLKHRKAKFYKLHLNDSF